jgi:integrase/recombinase XerD
MLPKINVQLGEHKSQKVIFVRFDYHKILVERIKQLTGAKWSQSQKTWYLPDNETYRQKFKLAPKVEASEATLNKICDTNQLALQKLIETIQLKGYSQSTLNTYRNEFIQLLIIIKHKPVETLSAERLRNYFLYCINTLKLSENTIHSRILFQS